VSNHYALKTGHDTGHMIVCLRTGKEEDRTGNHDGWKTGNRRHIGGLTISVYIDVCLRMYHRSSSYHPYIVDTWLTQTMRKAFVYGLFESRFRKSMSVRHTMIESISYRHTDVGTGGGVGAVFGTHVPTI
jgi:hypothetical protein